MTQAVGPSALSFGRKVVRGCKALCLDFQGLEG